MIVNTFMTMLALPSLYLLFGKDISTTHVPTVSTNGTTVHSGASEIQPSLHD
jgi:hypothetical protein